MGPLAEARNLIEQALAALERSAPAEALRSSTWAYPAVEVAHLLGVALLFGAIVAIDLRMLGRGTALPLAPLTAYLLPIAWAGFAAATVTGVALFATGATAYAANGLFQAKLAVLAAAGVNALVLHRAGGVRASAGPARVAAVASIVLWTAAVGLGRWVAYG